MAIVLIIGFHLLYEVTYSSSLRPIGFVGVSLFFIISGYVLAKNHPNLQKFSLKWFFKRFIKLASLYYLALIIIVILFTTQTYSGSWWDLFLHFIFLDPLSKTAAYTIISPAWFLTPLLALYILFPYLNKYVKQYLPLFLLLMFFVMIIQRNIDNTLTSYSPLFFIGEFCFGIAFAYGKKETALLISFVTIFIQPIMFLPFIIFYLVHLSNLKYSHSEIINFIGINTFTFFLFHESIIKVAFGKWHIYNLSIPTALILLVVLMFTSAYFSKKIQDYILKSSIFSGPLYSKSF
jgi:peptidoglycan/LPS O-acetylase OafA/YrhL